MLALESRVADLRQIEAALETVRQAHYAAGDQVNQAQGLLYEASTEVGRLEAEIRFVVEGRQRVEQRLQTLADQALQWATRRESAETELVGLDDQALTGAEQSELLAAQVEDQAGQLPELEDAFRLAQRSANDQRASVAQVQQQIQVLAVEEQARQLGSRLDRLQADRNALAAPDESRLRHLEDQLAQASDAATLAQSSLQELQDALPELETQRRRQQQDVNDTSARQAELSARLEALKALQQKVRTDGRLQPWLLRHGLEPLSAQ